MKRRLYEDLKKWKEERPNVSLLVDGARRIGKSWLVKEFAEHEYKSYILIDFSQTNKAVRELFTEYLVNLDHFFLHLETYYNVRLYPGKSLIIFDEVQMFPPARAALKFLVADGRYDYIETGSLLGIRENTKDIVIPSEERHIKMYPMDFFEFLWATGNEPMEELIRECFASRRPLGQTLHRKAIDLFRQYMIIGGMPQALSTFINTMDLRKVDKIKRDILELYRADIIKHGGRLRSKLVRLFDAIPGQLQKHAKKFRFSEISPTSRLRDYEEALFWLGEAMIVNVCSNTTEPNTGLKLGEDRSALKCYLGDTGLLISHAFDENELIQQEIHRRLMFDNLEINKGMLIENIVAQMLIAAGHKLYFFMPSSPQNAEERMEIDFLLTKSKIGRRHNVNPIEVKSSKNYTTVSLDKFRKKYSQFLDTPYLLHSKDLQEKDGIVYLPFYMTPLL